MKCFALLDPKCVKFWIEPNLTLKKKENKTYKYISWVCQNSQFLSKTEDPILEKVPLNSTKDGINYGEDTLAQLLPLSSETE